MMVCPDKTMRPTTGLWRSQAWTVCLLVVCSLLLSACGTSGGGGYTSSGGSTSGGGGGYYKDDGPGSTIPTNLDTIPDAVPRIEPLHKPALRPYTVMGQSFTPRTALTPYRERGHGSWYGKRFHGNPTSIGEPYDMYAMTAAHPTLPLPSYARVTNLNNGRTVIVRVNDRGPFLRGRIIDLSYAAAHRLGYINAGSALVEVESILPDEIRAMGNRPYSAPIASAPAVQVAQQVLAPVSSVALAPLVPPAAQAPLAVANNVANAVNAVNALNTAPANTNPQVVAAAVSAMQTLATQPTASSGYTPSGLPQAFLQLGAFATAGNASSMLNRVRSELGIMADRLHLIEDAGRYRLQLGPFASAEEARIEAGRIGAVLNLQPFVVLR